MTACNDTQPQRRKGHMIQYHTPSNSQSSWRPHIYDPSRNQYSIFRIMDTSVVEIPLDNSHSLPVIIPSYSSHSIHTLSHTLSLSPSVKYDQKFQSQDNRAFRNSTSSQGNYAITWQCSNTTNLYHKQWFSFKNQHRLQQVQHRGFHQYYSITHTQV